MKRLLAGLLLAGTLLLTGPFSVLAADPPGKGEDNARYTFRRDHDPNGIGKFYMGREIAYVMGYVAAPWLERVELEKEERLTLLIKSLKLKPGMVVADIGAGSGVISMLMAREIDPEGRVLAVDIQQEMLDRLKKRCEAAGVTNVVPVKGSGKSPNLKPGSVDLIIMVDVYHEFAFPYEMTAELAKALKPGGRIAWVEYRLEDPSVPIKLVHKMTEKQVKLEAGQPEFGLKHLETIGTLPWQHIVVFQKPEDQAK